MFSEIFLFASLRGRAFGFIIRGEIHVYKLGKNTKTETSLFSFFQ